MKFLFAILSLSFLAAALGAISVSSNKGIAPSTKPKALRCPDICTELYNPICAGNNGRILSFGNPCKLDLYNCNRNRKDRFIPVDSKICKNFSTCW